jgi:hypothetical protein
VKVTLAVVSLAIAAFVAYRAFAPRAFVSVGRGAITAEALGVERVAVQDSATGYNGERVNADVGKKFVSVDIRIAASPTEFDVDDFQLVKAKTAQPGSKENLGDPPVEADRRVLIMAGSCTRAAAQPPVGRRKRSHRRVSADLGPRGLRTKYLL